MPGIFWMSVLLQGPARDELFVFELYSC